MTDIPAAVDRRRDGARWHRRTLWLIGGLLLGRVIYAFVVPLDLVHDEAYYWDWSRRLDWGYFSKPPIVAWLIAAFTSLGGDHPFVVRLPAVLLGTLSLYGIYLLGARLYGARIGFWAALIAAATPGNAALALLMTVDAPLLFCWSFALYTFWRTLERDARRTRWLALTALTVGIGLLSKQTMFAFLALAVLFVATSPPDRRELRGPGLYACAIGALLCLMPVIWWNSQHGWVTLWHTTGHFATSDPPSWWQRIVFLVEFLGTELGLVTPVTAVLWLTVAVASALAFRRLGRRERFLFCFSGLPLLAVVGLSLTQRVEPNWPAPFSPAGIVLLVGWAQGKAGIPGLGGRRPALLWRAAIVGAAFTVATYLLPFVVSWTEWQGSRLDPTVRLRGWKQLGRDVGRLFDTMPRPANTFVVAVSGRALASELAFYMPTQPSVHVWSFTATPLSQYDIWGGPEGMDGRDALVVTADPAGVPPPLAASFENVTEHGRVEVSVGSGRTIACRVWRATGYRPVRDDTMPPPWR